MPSLAMTTFLLSFERENVPAGKSLRRTQNLSKFLLHLVLHGAFKMKSMKKYVNYVRHQLFECTYSSKDKIIDLSLLPPCRSSVRLHSLRANAVAKIWNDADQRTVHLPDLTLLWNEDFRIRWFDDAVPQNVIDILMDPNFDMIDDDSYGADQESDKEE